MAYEDYRESQRLALHDFSFRAIIMGAMRKADSDNGDMLRNAFPEIWHELQDRYNAPGGILPSERNFQKGFEGTS